jgi:CheY-like chemotaxis protein
MAPTTEKSGQAPGGPAPSLDDALHAQRLESLGRLAASVAHEYNNVLTVILSCGQALARAAERGAPASADEVRQLNAAAARAQELTRSLLAFAHREAIAPVALDLGEVLERARPMLARLLGEDVELAVTTAPALWPVRADPAQLDQVLMNLAANARDALPHGGRLELSAANLALAAPDPAWPGLAAGEYVRLSVADDGVGMTPEVQARAFDPFFTTKRKGQGTGLGLATVHAVVTQSGGHLRVESAPGRGTRFELLLPHTGDPIRAAEPAPRTPAGPRGGSETILLVEDDPGVRRQALRALAGAGYHVHVAADGEEAVALAPTLARAPDLLLTDVVMPRVDGPRLTEVLRTRWSDLRVMFTSGYMDTHRLPPDLPPTGFLQKPFTVSDLLDRVRAALDGARPRPGDEP